MRALSFTIAVVGLVTVASPLARAQEPDTLSPAQRAGLALARLGAGQHVRIRASGGGLVEGWVVSSSPNLVTLRTDGSRIEVPAPGVDSLWVRRGSAGRGALIGGAVGGIGLALVGAASCHGGRANEAPPGVCVAYGLVVGGAGGALVGALIGTAFPKWRLRVP